MSEFGLESAFMPGAFEVKLRSQDCRSGFRRWVFLPPFLPSLSGTCGPDTPAWVTCLCPSCQEPGVFPAGSKARAHRRPIKAEFLQVWEGQGLGHPMVCFLPQMQMSRMRLREEREPGLQGSSRPARLHRLALSSPLSPT